MGNLPIQPLVHKFVGTAHLLNNFKVNLTIAILI
jgi:hypothetical protein